MPNIKRMMMAAAGGSGGASTETVGELWTWGGGWSGQLGLGNTTNRSEPTQVGSLTDWEKVNAGSRPNNNAAIKTDGTLWTWGYNYYGSLGIGTSQASLGANADKSSPVQVGSLTNWFIAGGGDNCMVAIKTDGTLWSWGLTNYGQGGRNNSTNVSSPVQIGSLTDWKGSSSDEVLTDGETKIGSGSYNSHIIKNDGTLWGWGWGAQSTVGDSSTTNRSSPVQIGSGTDWASISPSYSYNVCAVKTGGTLWTWGRGDEGALGHGDTTTRNSPVQVGSLTTWKFVCAGYKWSCAVKTDGTLWAWGDNSKGQLGLGDTTSRSSPVQVGSLTDWLRPLSGYQHNRVLKTDGTLWAWGNNDVGQLGLGDTTNRSSPVQVGSAASWGKVLGGNTHTAAVR